LKYNYGITGSSKRKMLEQEMLSESSRQQDLCDEVTEWEGQKGLGRNPKKCRSEQEVEQQSGAKQQRSSSLGLKQLQTLEGKQRCGNFWPKDVFEKEYQETLSKADTKFWTQNGHRIAGTFRPLSEPIVPGVIEVSNISQMQLEAHEELPVLSANVQGMFKDGAKALTMKSKQVRNDDGTVALKVSMKASTRKDTFDDDDDDDDLFGSVWNAPLAAKGSCNDSDDETAVGKTGRKSKPGFKRGALPTGVAEGSPPSAKKPKAPADGILGGESLSYKDRQKQMSTLQSGRSVLVDAKGFISKAADPVICLGLTVKSHIAVAKKLQDAVHPNKQQWYTMGLDVDKLMGDSTDGSEVSEGMSLLKELNDTSKHIVALGFVVTAIADAKAPLELFQSAIKDARAAGVSLPSSLNELILSRACDRVIEDKDYGQLMKIMANSGIIDGIVNLSWAAGGDAQVALQMQERVITKRLLEVFRIGVITKAGEEPASSGPDLVKFTTSMSQLAVCSEIFKKQLVDLILLAKAIDSEYASGVDMADVTTARKAITEDCWQCVVTQGFLDEWT
jgi:hypothetical protein